MNKDSNKNQTFAEKLKEHTELSRKTGEKAQSLMAQAEKAMANSDGEKADKLLAGVELLLKTTDSTLQDFETNHKEEFLWLNSLPKKTIVSSRAG
ncbi:MAG: hypothetical protein A2912_04855 [Candidatus Buchananbacteria bacterium RIFCSPLOWO2_01_FULL_40_23b]|uniref:Uncharacterized protein n=1 Tax=Candidatus Buchananbacteria bacterium RIFCSPLOWO2_01_FULL_40_23b TaxID=1797544 RepID=A0A1G1YQF3_9BACT|nr:MAG: hypothetical protein A2912_04855 [Candidatus Buchananbacteria bacterium RIFCSPLOWO2_01_FULL_40_23b]